MFNYNIYKRQVNLSKSIEKIKKEYIDDREKRKEQNQKLSQNYRKRVENFVINMLENPIPTNDYLGPNAHSIRDENPEKFVGDAQIYVKGFKHEKDRIKEALIRNSDLDFLPNSIVAAHNFRPRQIGKEIQPDMRFKDKTSLERIEQFLKDHTQTQVENMDFNKSKKSFRFDTLSNTMTVWEKRAFIARQMAKNLLPSLHQKTHFQATQTLYNNLPLTLCDHGSSLPHLNNKNSLNSSIENNESEIEQKPSILKEEKKQSNKAKREKNVQIQEGEQVKSPEQKLRSKGDQLETFNPVQTSKQVLQTCNVIKKRNPKVKLMKQGDGHLISTLDRSISEMYRDLYNIDLSQHSVSRKHFRKSIGQVRL